SHDGTDCKTNTTTVAATASYLTSHPPGFCGGQPINFARDDIHGRPRENCRRRCSGRFALSRPAEALPYRYDLYRRSDVGDGSVSANHAFRATATCAAVARTIAAAGAQPASRPAEPAAFFRCQQDVAGREA